MKAFTRSVLLLLVASAWAGCASSGAIEKPSSTGHIDAAANPNLPVGTTDEAVVGRSVRSSSFDVAAQTVPAAFVVPGSERTRVAPDVTPASQRYTVAEPPPIPETKPLHLRPIRPAREAIWIDGHWAYTGNPSTPYEWMSGHWEIPPPGGRAWVPSAWQRTGNKFVYVRGHWQ